MVRKPAAVSASQPILVSRSGGGQYRTISEAIRRAKPGARLLVRSGLYRESLIIDRPLTIEAETDGDAASVLVESDLGAALVSRADQVVVRRLHLRTADEQAEHAVEVHGGHLILDHCEVSGGRESSVVAAGAKTELTLRRGTIQDARGDGLRLARGASARVENSLIERAGGSGIAALSGKLSLLACRIKSSRAAGLAVTQSEAAVSGGSIDSSGTADVEISSGGNVTLRAVRIGGGPDQTGSPAPYGIRVLQGGRCAVDDATIQGQTKACVAIERSEGTVIRGSKIRGSGGLGVSIAGGACRIEDCEIYENMLGGVEASKLAEPTLRRCLIHDNTRKAMRYGTDLYNGDFGLRFVEGARGLVEESEVYSNGGIGVVLMSDANPTFRDCKAYSHPQHGVAVVGAKGVFEKLETYKNGNCGFLVQQKGEPHCINSDFRDNGWKGLALEHEARGTFVDCAFTANAEGVMSLSGSNPTLRRCRLERNRGRGLTVASGASGLFEDCQVVSNNGGASSVEAGCRPQFLRCVMR